MTLAADNLLIVGAGFSRNAGLPLASEFTRELLNVRALKVDGPSALQVAHIRAFVDAVFGEGARRSPDEWPELEDIFTLLDLSANTGHHLGPNYSASDLRVVRRAVIVRMIRMLNRAYERGRDGRNASWMALETFFEQYDADSSAVLSMNWDTVFERGVARAQGRKLIDYGCDAKSFTFSGDSLRRRRLTGDSVTVLKPHGSINWLYCDACRETVWTPPERAEKVAQTLFRRKDWEAIDATRSSHPTVFNPACPHCRADSLGTRFATFSYRKALDFPMHAASWRSAETLLKRTSEWVFIGYSMPAADFEFKQLLKRVQLSERIRPKITLITAGDGAPDTIARFKKFFGEVSGERAFFDQGLDGPAMSHLRSIGVLKKVARSKP